jgi:hypothetical protein
LLDGSEDFKGISTVGVGASTIVHVHFRADRVVLNMASVGSGFAPLKLEKMSSSSFQDLGVYTDAAMIFQLRMDGASPFWKLVGGSYL